MGIIFLTSDLIEVTRGQKHPSKVENGMKVKGVKFLMKVAQQPPKTLTGPIRFELQPQGKKIQQPPRSLYKTM
jgi:hypothetical protein